MTLTTITLTAHDRPRIEDHLLRLSPDDRSLRFAAGLVTDETVRSYASRIRFGHDIVLGLEGERGTLLGLAHGCVYEVRGALHVEAAFSVDEPWRGRRLASGLMDAVRTQAQAIGAACVVGMCAVRNLPMRRVFAGAGMTLTREDDEVHAHGRVSPA